MFAPAGVSGNDPPVPFGRMVQAMCIVLSGGLAWTRGGGLAGVWYGQGWTWHRGHYTGWMGRDGRFVDVGAIRRCVRRPGADVGRYWWLAQRDAGACFGYFLVILARG